MLTRRALLRSTGAAALAAGLARVPYGWAAPVPGGKKKHLLVFTRSQGFQHPVVEVKGGKPCLVDTIWTELAAKHNFEVTCTKDGRIFLPETLAKFDAFFFYTTGDLTVVESKDGSPPMPKEGKKALLDAVAAGKGFIGSHCASDTFHSPGTDDPLKKWSNQDKQTADPFIQMLGGEFIKHDDQQKAWMRVVDSRFPGATGLTDFQMHEEWYSLKNFAPDLHVILVQDTRGMDGPSYQRPKFPATWARMHGKGRVYYTSMGHREDVWANPLFQNLLLGALSWVTGEVDADVTPNLQAVTPEASALPKPPPDKPRANNRRPRDKARPPRA
jgi:type 1 glutamine amidotransferase